MSTSKVTALTDRIRTYFDQVAVRLKETAAHVISSQNAQTLGGSTIAQIEAEIDPTVTAHENNKSNPHGVTALQLGSYTKNEVEIMLKRRVSESIIPVSRFGSLDMELPLITAVTSGWMVNFAEVTPLIINGRYAPLAPMILNLTTVKTNPSDSTFFVYVTIVNATASYVVHTTQVAETAVLMFIGTIVTGSTKVNSIDITKFTKFGGFRLSSVPRGQSIPTTGGLPSRVAHLHPLWI